MITSIELQIISKILTTDDPTVVDTLCSYDETYYSVFRPHIEFILQHRQKYSDVPDVFTFQSEFPDITLVSVNEPLEYLQSAIKKNKQHIMLLQTFNKLKDLGSEDVTEAWAYLSKQCDAASQLDDAQPMNIVSQAKERSDMIIKFSQQERIPTGFPEIDKLMYGGLSTVEEFLDNQILTLKRGSDGNFFLNQNFTCYPTESYLQDDGVMLMVNRISRLAKNRCHGYIGFPCNSRTRSQIQTDLQSLLTSSLRVGTGHGPESLRVQCDDSNNPASLEKQGKVQVNIYSQFSRGINEVLVYSYIQSL